MKKVFLIVLVSFTFLGSRQYAEDPELIAKNYLNDLINLDSASYIFKYKISKEDMDWFSKKLIQTRS